MTLPDLESLRCFAAAARQQNFRAAAKVVALSPTAFSERIRRLEEQLAAPLFERTTRRITLTPAGERLLPQVEILLTTAGGLRSLAAAASQPPFELTIGTRFELGLSWLVPALDELALGYPHRTLHLRFGDTDDLVRAVVVGHADAAVSSARLTVPGLEHAPLHEETYVAVAATAAPALDGPLDAPRHTLVDATADLPLFRYLLDAAPVTQPWRFARYEYLGAIAAIAQRVVAGKGVAVLPQYLVQAEIQQGQLRVLLPQWPPLADRFRLLWRRDHPRRQALLELAAQLRNLPLQ